MYHSLLLRVLLRAGQRQRAVLRVRHLQEPAVHPPQHQPALRGVRQPAARHGETAEHAPPPGQTRRQW